MSTRDSCMNAWPGNWPWFPQLTSRSDVFADEEVEIETLGLGLSKHNSNVSYWAYAGVVTRIGNAVKGLFAGHRVLTIAPVFGANRIRVPGTHAGGLPQGISPAAGAILWLDTMAAYYTLQSQARRLPEGSVLVHDALSPGGKAAVAVARSIGARVRVAASTLSEASLVMTELHIPDDYIISTRRTQSSRTVDIGDFDIIVQTGRNEVPGKILQHL